MSFMRLKNSEKNTRLGFFIYIVVSFLYPRLLSVTCFVIKATPDQSAVKALLLNNLTYVKALP